MRLLTVNVVEELIPGPKETGLTAIDKRPQTGRVRVRQLGLEGDRVCDTKNHGGPDLALYAYAEEDAKWWSAEFGGPDHQVTVADMFAQREPAKMQRMLDPGVDLMDELRETAQPVVTRA